MLIFYPNFRFCILSIINNIVARMDKPVEVENVQHKEPENVIGVGDGLQPSTSTQNVDGNESRTSRRSRASSRASSAGRCRTNSQITAAALLRTAMETTRGILRSRESDEHLEEPALKKRNKAERKKVAARNQLKKIERNQLICPPG